MALLGDDKYLVAVCDDGVIKMWNINEKWFNYSYNKLIAFKFFYLIVVIYII